MNLLLRLLVAAALLATPLCAARAQKLPATIARLSGDAANKSTDESRASDDKKESNDGKKAETKKSASDAPAPAAELTIIDPLLQVLLKNRMISTEDARKIMEAGSAIEQRNRLAALLFDRGLISANDYSFIQSKTLQINGGAPAGAGAALGDSALAANAAQDPRTQTPPSRRPSEATPAPNRAAPPVIPAVAPNRPLQVEATRRDSIVPDIKLGGGIKLKLNGFLKASVVYDSTNPGGVDSPAPLLAADTGPRTAGEFRVKARSIRLGGTFEGLDPSPKTSIIGRFEFDFEGNFQVGGNSIRNPNPRLRLGYVRIDHKSTDDTSFFALFGQDWSPFLGSTLTNTIETTNQGLNFGNAYDRLPQARFGLDHNFGGARKFHLAPEFAVVLPKYGITQNLAAATDLNTQLSIGEREGTDSRRPEIQGRIVAQFQLDDAPGVQPAQLVGSFMQGSRRSIVTAANVPAAFRSAFASGAEVTSDRYGFSTEATLPTRFLTLSAKYYTGSDLASFGAGQGLTIFNDAFGLTGATSATTVDGRTVIFGFLNGQPVVAPQRSVRAEGGFIELGVPLSRLFDAEPKGRFAGFDANFHYGYDEARPRDARSAASNRGKSDWAFANLRYKYNSFLTFAFEQSYYRTRAINNSTTDFRGLPLLRGVAARSSHDNRSEFATIFTF